MALLGAADIIDRSWEVVRRNAAVLAQIVIVFLIPSTIGTVAYELLRRMDLGIGPWQQPILGFAIFLPVVVLSLIETIALTRAIAAGMTGASQLPLGTLLRNTLPVMLPTLVASLALSVLLFAGMLVLVVPFVIMAVWFAFILQAIALDGASWRGSFGISKGLVAGRFAPVMWRLVAPYLFWLLVTWVVTALLVFAMNSATGEWTVRVAANAALWVQVGAEVLSDIVGAAMAPFFLATTTILYLNLKSDSGPDA